MVRIEKEQTNMTPLKQKADGNTERAPKTGRQEAGHDISE
jgi:hypothetical protein